MNIVLLGPPGVGKGTYAKELSRALNIPHISTGDILREEIKHNTSLGKRVREYVESGKLVPDEIMIEIIKARLSQKDCRNGYILDGFPRTLPQAEALDRISKVDIVFNFVAPKYVIIERLSGRLVCKKCGAIYHKIYHPPKKEGICDTCGGPLYQREDDRPDVIEQRLKIYHQQTKPLIRYYRGKGLLVDIDASRDVKEVIKDCIHVLRKRGILRQENNQSTLLDESKLIHIEGQEFSMELEKGKKAFLRYTLRNDHMYIIAVYTPPAFRGKGIASFLARKALDYARSKGYKVIPLCGFMRRFIKKNPEYSSLCKLN